ncbi:Histidine phosphatase [Aureococcus anophagefferens]|nr:Histidine phosphatase [Aureococcus anophagefferens]
MRQLLLAGRRALKNEFVALRHGWSEANEAGIIVSRIESGRLPRYGLHAKGRAQAAAVAEPLAALAGAREVVVLASDFSRTLDTAAVARSASASASAPAPGARERDFGDLDGGPNDTYEDVWARDAADAGHEWSRVESVERVRADAAAVAGRAGEAGSCSSSPTATRSRSSRRPRVDPRPTGACRTSGVQPAAQRRGDGA